MYRPLAHGKFKEGGGVCELEGFPREGRIEGSKALSLGKRTTFQKGKHLNKGMMVGRGGWRRWHPVTACLAHLILVATPFFPSQDALFSHSQIRCFQSGSFSIWECELSLANESLSWEFCLIY